MPSREFNFAGFEWDRVDGGSYLVDCYVQASSWDGSGGAVLAEFDELIDVFRTGAKTPIRDTQAWRVDTEFLTGRGERLYIPAIGPDGTVLAVRCIPLSEHGWGDEGRHGPLVLSASTVGSRRGVYSELADLPAPFSRGVLDPEGPAVTTFVVRSPFTAAILNREGVRASTMSTPSETLGSEGGLRQLVGLGALTVPEKPRGTLVIADGGGSLTSAGGALLRSLYSEVVEVDGWESEVVLHKVVRHCRNRSRATLARYLKSRAQQEGRRVTVSARPLPTLSGEGETPARVEFSELRDIASTPGDPVNWVVPKIAAAGTLTDLIGEPKVGKSTLLLEAMRALSEGGRFLGEWCEPGRVVFVSEQTRASLRATLSQMEWDGGDVSVLTAEGTANRTFDETLAVVKAKVEEVGADLVVFDTLSAVAGLGDQMNSATTARTLLRKVRSLCNEGVAVIVTRHTTKAASGGHEVPLNQAGAGSFAHAADVDHIVLYTLVGGQDDVRLLRTKGRLGAGERIEVAWTGTEIVRADSTSSTPNQTGGRRRATAASQETTVLRALAEVRGPAPGVKEILSALKGGTGRTLSESVVRTTLARLVEQGRVTWGRDGRRHVFSITPAGE